jgi:alpha-ribazole phosphatase
MVTTAVLHVWRHPRPDGVAGRCIGQVDVPVDRRRAKRLAHRIRRQSRRDGGPREVWTSPLQRAACVGRWLARWGWRHRVDPRLAELDFGSWDGETWERIGPAPVDAWCRDFARHAPGGGESVEALLARCGALLGEWTGARSATRVYAVGHAGWINAVRLLTAANGPGSPGGPPPGVADWPPAVAYGTALQFALTGTAPISA